MQRWIVFCWLLPAAPLLAQPAKLTVAAVQFRSSFQVEDNRRRIVEMLEQLAGQGVQVPAFPECALTGYDKDTLPAASPEALLAAESSLARACRDRRIAVVVGSVLKTGGRAYNTAVVINSRGELVERYAKIMLAGEKWATPGNHIAYFELEGIPSTLLVCHDERYPELVRLPALQGARVVYYISHESGLREESKLAPYRAQLMARAVENRVFVVAANAPANSDLSGSHGQSRILSSDGNLLKEAGFFGQEVLVETLAIEPGRLTRPFEGPLGDWWRQGVEWMMRNRERKLE